MPFFGNIGPPKNDNVPEIIAKVWHGTRGNRLFEKNQTNINSLNYY